MASDLKVRSKNTDHGSGRSRSRSRGKANEQELKASPETLSDDDGAEKESGDEDEEEKEEDEDEEVIERRRQRDRAMPHFCWESGMPLGPDGRYIVEHEIGEGTFGRVLSCVDKTSGQKVAVKVVKGVRRYFKDAELEAKILREVMRCDPMHKSRCVRLFDSFKHPIRHYCIVFEQLDLSLRDFLKGNRNVGLLLRDIRLMSQQLLQCLAFLHSIGLIHTDLKCRNVMLRNANYSSVRLPRSSRHKNTRSPLNCDIAVIDFGGACYMDECHDGRIGTRQYRAPEVVLGLLWDEKSDIWSAACIIAMLYIGTRPFRVHESVEHLAIMERLVGGPIPLAMVTQACKDGPPPDDIKFDFHGRLIWPFSDADDEAIENVQDTKALSEVVAPQHVLFLKLLQGLFELDPRRRLSADVSLQAPFFTESTDIPE